MQAPGEHAIMSAFSGNQIAVSFNLTFIPNALPTVMVAGYCDGIIRWYPPAYWDPPDVSYCRSCSRRDSLAHRPSICFDASGL